MSKIEEKNGDFDINFERIVELISKYEQIKNSGEIKRYNEESTKKDFILPLFEALGWNVYNRSKRNDSISAEETISKKRVDYGFRINGIPKFFLEAKSMKEENIQTNPKYVTQAIDYAWMKSCSWAILCNFETIAVYNADWKESNYGNNLFFVLHPSDFLTDRRITYFSKIAFENNELDKIASKYGKKQLKNPINKQLLEDMIHFREVLSKDVVRNNQDKHLTQDDIDESIQRILDRLIFIRNAEDRGLEENQLQSNVRQWYAKGKGHLVKEISRIYKDYDEKYNSKLFAHHLCDDLYIENEALQEVIEGLNQSKDNSYRYDFSIIESDVLGNIYEQYLGNILKSTPKRAKLEESKTHRKEQGIYYTPSYIVDYIVKNTVGEYIKTHKPEEIRKVKILDPACGSGSFLIRVYKELEDYWKKELKLDESGLMQTKFDTQNSGEVYTLKTEILKNNIFGVDLDPKAVEIAQLNLLLQISERGHRLPLLQNNIKIGNSLIGDSSISDRAFKWVEEFPEIMKDGGFDIVIGNPPYGAELSEKERGWISRFYSYSKSYKNTALIFIEKSLNLLNNNGKFGMIVPKSLAYSQEWKNGRKLVKDKLYRVVDVSKAFEDVLLEQLILILEKNNTSSYYTLENITYHNSLSIEKKYIDLTDSIILHDNPQDFEIFKMMIKSTKRLRDISKTSRGIPFQKHVVKTPTKYKILRGRDIKRYHYSTNAEFLPENMINLNMKKIEFLRRPKIVSQRIVAHVTKPSDHIIIMSAMDRDGIITLDTVENTVIMDERYSFEFLLSLLNSELISWYAYRYIFSKAIRTMDLDDYYIGKIPLPEKEIDNLKFVKLTNNIISLYKSLNKLTNKETDHKIKISNEIEKCENDINNAINNMYLG
ncbi:MAG: N-6 DNA methylase [Thermoplasmatales archaeon]|nr:MAG: N-6 DNA methylase [Thermoplasmatales archaeon]